MVNESSNWSQEQADKLQHEAFMAEVLRLRAPAVRVEQPKPWWQRFLESHGGTALITVVLGGLMGSLITGMIQGGAKEREFEQAWVKARGDQALVAYKEYLEQQRETVKRAYELIGNCVSASDDLIEVTGPDFDPRKYPGVEKQRLEFRQNYNDYDRKWRGDREALGLLVTYYHHGEPAVINAWTEAKESVSKYMDCAADWYLHNNHGSAETLGACKPQRDRVNTKLAELGKAADQARHFAWEGWESPEALRGQLSVKKRP